MKKAQTTAEAHRIFKNIRNRIGRVNVEDLLRNLLELLDAEDAITIERQRYIPVWDLLLLVKWTILHGDYSNLRKHDPVWPNQVDKLLSRMYNLAENTHEIFDKSSRRRFVPQAFAQSAVLVAATRIHTYGACKAVEAFWRLGIRSYLRGYLLSYYQLIAERIHRLINSNSHYGFERSRTICYKAQILLFYRNLSESTK